MKKYSVTKSLIECYKIKQNNNFGWANIVVDAMDETGRIQIASDYGSWQYYWGSCGYSFKKFLIKLDQHYAANKFGEANWFDLEKTVERLKKRIKEYTSDKEERKSLMNEINDLEQSSCKSEFEQKMWMCTKIMNMEDNCPEFSYSISPAFTMFWKEIWPVFIDVLQKEISVS